jgi:hypothetical protein
MLSEKHSLDDIATMEVADLADYLKDKGRNRFPIPEHFAKCIQKAAALRTACPRSLRIHGSGSRFLNSGDPKHSKSAQGY